MHNLHFKLKYKIDEDKLVELKREGLRVDRWLRNTGRNMRNRAAVNEIKEFQTLEDLP